MDDIKQKQRVPRRRTYEERSICVWMQKGETNANATQRLADEWKRGVHPVQIMRNQVREE